MINKPYQLSDTCRKLLTTLFKPSLLYSSLVCVIMSKPLVNSAKGCFNCTLNSVKTNESRLLPLKQNILDAVTRHTEISLNAIIALKMKLNRKNYQKHFILYCNLHKRMNSITYKYRLHFTALNINDVIPFLFNKLDGLYFHEIWPFYLSCL